MLQFHSVEKVQPHFASILSADVLMKTRSMDPTRPFVSIGRFSGDGEGVIAQFEVLHDAGMLFNFPQCLSQGYLKKCGPRP